MHTDIVERLERPARAAEAARSADSDFKVTEITAPDITDLGKFLKGPQGIPSLAVVGIFLLSLFYFLYFARPFLLPVVLALMLSFLLKPVVRLMARFKIPQPIGSAVLLIFLVITLGNYISLLTQPAAEWMARAPESLRQVERKVRHLLRPVERLTKAAEQVENLTKGAETESEAAKSSDPGSNAVPVATPGVASPKPLERAREAAPKIQIKQSNLADTMLSYTKSFLTGAVETIVLLYFLLASGDLFMQKLVKVLPTLQDKKHAVEIAHEVQHNISIFLFTITIINLCLGMIVGLALWVLHMPNPILWGVVAGLLNFIPYFGPITGVLILAFAGLVTTNSVGEAVLPPLIYLSLHALESNFITPMILGRRLTLNPVVIFISLIFWTWIWGIPGAVLSVPMLMTLKIFCDHFKPLASIGEFLSG